MITEDRIPARLHFLLLANPMYFAVRAYRQALLSSRLPDFHDIGMLAIYGAVLFVVGGLFFRYMKRGFADVL